MRCRYNAVIFHKYSVGPVSDWRSALAPVIIYVTFYNIGPRYNGIRLYVYEIQSASIFLPSLIAGDLVHWKHKYYNLWDNLNVIAKSWRNIRIMC